MVIKLKPHVEQYIKANNVKEKTYMFQSRRRGGKCYADAIKKLYKVQKQRRNNSVEKKRSKEGRSAISCRHIINNKWGRNVMGEERIHGLRRKHIIHFTFTSKINIGRYHHSKNHSFGRRKGVHENWRRWRLLRTVKRLE